MNAVFFVMLGGALGAAARFGVGKWALASFGAAYPMGTLIANVAGGFLMGVLAACLTRFVDGGENARLFLGVGVLGGFTTFSAFTLEIAVMVERGELGHALFYAFVSVAASLLALFAGLFVVRGLAGTL